MVVPLVLLLFSLHLPVAAQAEDPDQLEEHDDLTELSLEELLEIEVVSVSRKSQTVPRSPAAVYVITQEDIRRSGMSSIPEVLRMATGLHVARINGNSWAIAARGFNGRFNNKMLVMVDGRTVFTSLFSGVYWDSVDLHLADIERIEVIRGPGGTMWGANAVNGVINIITKSAEDTQGTEYSLRTGTEDTAILSWRHGEALENGHWRVYAKAFERGNSESAGGGEHPDDWRMARLGFRTDWQADAQDAYTLQGDFYGGNVEERSLVKRVFPPPDEIFEGTFRVTGANLLGRWKRRESESKEFELQAYVDHTHREADLYSDDRLTLDLDFQQRFRISSSQDILWGAGYRLIESHFQGSPSFDLRQGRRSDQYLSAFVQDEVAMIEDELTLTLGAKFEHNDFTGFETEPSARLLWAPHEDHTVWASISRAIRIPSVVQHDLVHEVVETIGPTTDVVTTLFGTDDLGSDELIAYELGWRFRLNERTYADLTAFYNDFDAADNFSVGSTIDLGGGNFVVPVFFDNARKAQVYGFEASTDIEFSDTWKIRSGLTLLDLQFEGDTIGTPIQPRSDEEEPNLVANLRSYWDINEASQLDIGLYGVDRLDDLDVAGYLRVDARFSYRPSDHLTLVIGVQNATDDQHTEFASSLLTTASELERAFYLGLEWAP